MTKSLLVISDSHGSVTTLKKVFDWAKDRIPPKGTICAAVCLGDGLADIRIAAEAAGFFCDWKIICGNNDYGIQAPETAVFDFADKRFFITHGHRYNLYNGFNTLLAAAGNSEADAALFGHTHLPYYKNINGILLINPGSVSRPRSRIGATFAVIKCEEDKPLIVEFYGIGRHSDIRLIEI
ncbi:MAG: metallophosphoesterase [Treponema sp.]|nr:metallophosphoesterase [Treponema sp.]